jgi:vacuolar-type H+-ATPase subunit I/STV1
MTGTGPEYEDRVVTSRDSDSSAWMVGFTAFAAMMMMLMGFFQVSVGLIALFNQEFYVTTPEYVFAFDVGTWAWIHLIWGAIVLIAGFSLLSGATWARVLGAVIAAISAAQAFVFLPYQPFWSIIIIAVSVLVIWALTTRVDDVESSLD